MISSVFALGLREAVRSNMKPNELQSVMRFLEDEANNIDVASEPMEFIASYIHQIYASDSCSVRASVIRIITSLEINSKDSVHEKFGFDLLVAASLDQNPANPTAKVDEEKVATFRFVSLIIKYRRHIPCSIIRALVSLYNTPKHCMKPLIVSHLCEAVMVCRNLPTVPEMTAVFIDTMRSAQDKVMTGFMGYVFENRCPMIQQPHFISRLLSPLSELSSNPTNLGIVCGSISQLLRTWPGLFCLGFQIGAIQDLLTALMHRPEAVIGILEKIMVLNSDFRAVTDSFSGFLLCMLFKNGILEKLDHLAKRNATVARYLRSLLPYSVHYSAKMDVSSHQSGPIEFSIKNKESMDVILKVSQSLMSRDLPSTVIDFTLPVDEVQWDWEAIQSLLMVVLPHNDAEAQSPQAHAFYGRLLEYYSSGYLSEGSPNKMLISDCLFRLTDLLCSNEWGQPILSAAEQFSASIMMAFESFCSRETDNRDSVWMLTKCLLRMMTKQIGIEVIIKWGKFGKVEQSIAKCTNIDSLTRVIKAIKFYPVLEYSKIIYLDCLASDQIAHVALVELREKAKTTPNFYIHGFEAVLVEHIKRIANNPSQRKHLNVALNILCELIMSDPLCLQVAAKDSQLHKILIQFNRHVYSVFFSRNESFAIGNMQDEIAWWIQTGIKEYVSIYDKATEVGFDSSVTDFTPSVVVQNGYVKTPPHLFGQLVQTEAGVKALTPHIPEIMKMLESPNIVDVRAALFALGQFGSVSDTVDYIRRHKVIPKMIKNTLETDSYIVRGTLIVSLSFMYVNHTISDTLQKNGFQFFRFGSHTCVVPVDPASLFIPIPANKISPPPLKEPPSRYGELASQLLNPLYDNAAKEELKKQVQENPEDVFTTENAEYIMRLLANFGYSTVVRQSLFAMFKHCPLMKRDESAVDEPLAAECAVRLNEAQILSQNAFEAANYIFSTVIIPKLSVADVKAKRPNSRAPEVYLSDSDFTAAMGVGRVEFYALPEDERNKKRVAVFK